MQEGSREPRRLELPWPPKAASANGSHGGWRTKSDAAKGYKTLCLYSLKGSGVRPVKGWPDGYCPTVVTFHPPRNGRMDADNAVNRIKSGLDAVADAIGVDDGWFWPMLLVKGDKCPGGRVVVCIHPPGTNIADVI